MTKKRHEQTKQAKARPTGDSCSDNDCCRLFYAHHISGRNPLVVLECCSCGDLWYQREDGTLVRYKQVLGDALSRYPSELTRAPPK